MLPYFREFIKTIFSHNEAFDNCPGQVYLMIILDGSNTSSEIDNERAEKAFTNLSFNHFRDEKIYDIPTTDPRQTKVMRYAYALPPKLGTNIF